MQEVTGQELAQSGWIDGRNVRIDVRWGEVDPERIRSYAADLIALAPDVIVATGSATVGSLLQATRAVPIIFVLAARLSCGLCAAAQAIGLREGDG
jgi:ABC-type uncharacterized transport system substrate-binding protein